ncbi:hypothetical protein [Oceanibacterium hippocampi]|uniref:Uncharacterized protein n=1 Tax=Oceanibacterium hippocampi TaxID=745714 RepID=A0A1Y5U3B3_9PROT|nr:hypothetical protein [Oceanibacterium hippocampi]SLN77463.1 hypothetical protein OCH7691_04428 [Oceanibacterium hippocampi]
MTIRHWTRTAALAAALTTATAAADAATTISFVSVDNPYSPSLVAYAARDGEFAVEFRGDALPGGQSGEAALGGLTTSGGHPPALLTTRPSDDGAKAGNNSYRLVFLVNPERLVNAARVCRAPDDIPVRADGGRTDILAAFCIGERAYSWGYGSVGADEGAAGIHDLLGQLVLNVIPYRDPEAGGCGKRPC